MCACGKATPLQPRTGDHMPCLLENNQGLESQPFSAASTPPSQHETAETTTSTTSPHSEPRAARPQVAPEIGLDQRQQQALRQVVRADGRRQRYEEEHLRLEVGVA